MAYLSAQPSPYARYLHHESPPRSRHNGHNSHNHLGTTMVASTSLSTDEDGATDASSVITDCTPSYGDEHPTYRIMKHLTITTSNSNHQSLVTHPCSDSSSEDDDDGDDPTRSKDHRQRKPSTSSNHKSSTARRRSKSRDRVVRGVSRSFSDQRAPQTAAAACLSKKPVPTRGVSRSFSDQNRRRTLGRSTSGRPGLLKSLSFRNGRSCKAVVETNSPVARPSSSSSSKRAHSCRNLFAAVEPLPQRDHSDNDKDSNNNNKNVPLLQEQVRHWQAQTKVAKTELERVQQEKKNLLASFAAERSELREENRQLRRALQQAGLEDSSSSVQQE